MATDMFLKLDGIKGESQDSKHKEEIEITSFSFGVHQLGSASSGGGAGTGKASFDDLHVSKRADKATPIFMQKSATGEHIKNAVLTVRKAGKDQQEYYTIKMTDLIVSGVTNLGTDGEVPSEQVSLNFSTIEFTYKEQKQDGSLGGTTKFGWDLKKVKPI